MAFLDWPIWPCFHGGMDQKRTTPPVDPFDYQVWLDGIVNLEEGAALRGVAINTLKKYAGDKIIAISARRRGIRRRDALMIAGG